ncbi:MAG: CvpA family protein [Chloroflexota bacterium]|nr:CvpA family protein [Chloroflexota bacterium]
MHWLDILIIVFLVLSTLLGVWRGMISTILPLAGLIGGIVLAGRYYNVVGGWLPIDNPEYAKWTAFAIIVVVVLIVAIILALLLKRLLRRMYLGWADMLGGGILGLLLGAIMTAAILAACVKFQLGVEVVQQSGIAAFLLGRFPAILALLPAEFDVVSQFFQ